MPPRPPADEPQSSLSWPASATLHHPSHSLAPERSHLPDQTPDSPFSWEQRFAISKRAGQLKQCSSTALDDYRQQLIQELTAAIDDIIDPIA